jgi:hypothetical protein
MASISRQQRGAAPPSPPIDLGHLRTLLGGSIDEYLTLSDVLRLRACGAGLARQYHPEQSPQLWHRIRPPLNQFHRTAVNMTPAGAELFEPLYRGAARHMFREQLRVTACLVDNVDLVGWYHEGRIDARAEADSLRLLCQYGHAASAARFAAQYSVAPAELNDWQFFATACDTGNIKMAEWLLTFGQYPTEEGGFKLVHRACRSDNLEFAAWVMTRFPFAVQSAEVCAVLGDPRDLLPGRARRWLIETFDLAWSDVRSVFSQVLAWTAPNCSDTRPDQAADQAVHNWIVARYRHDWAAEFRTMPVGRQAERSHQFINECCDSWAARH